MVKPKLSDEEFRKLLAQVKKDPKAMKDIRRIIKITTGTYKLKHYDLD